MSDSYQGKPPKSKEGIRASLQSIGGKTTTQPVSGPLIDGFRADSQIVAGSFYDFDIATSFQDLLGQENIFSERIRSRKTVKIVVDAEDSKRASELFLEHRERFPDRRPNYVAQRFDYLVFGVITGLAMSMIFIDPMKLDLKVNPIAVVVPITFAFFLGALGHLFDRLRVHKKRTGRIRLGIWELMILVTIPVVYILVKDLIPKALFPENN